MTTYRVMTPAGLELSRASAANRLSPPPVSPGQSCPTLATAGLRGARDTAMLPFRARANRVHPGVRSPDQGSVQQQMLTQHHQSQRSKQPRGRARWRRCWSSIAALAVICAHLGLVLHGAVHETLTSDTPCALCVAANQLCSAASHPTLAVSPAPEASPPARDSFSCLAVPVPTGLARGPPLFA